MKITFSIDKIRREAFQLLADTQCLSNEDYSAYVRGVTDLVMRLAEQAGEDAPACLI